MRRPLTSREREIVDLAGGLADRFTARAGTYDRENRFPVENYVDLKESGYLRLSVPEEFGGFGASLHEIMLAQERLAMGDPGTALAVNMHVVPIGQWAGIWRINHNPAIAAVLAKAGSGELVWAGFTSERGVANTIMDANTKAEKVDGGYRITGYKTFCTNIAVATDFTITARLDGDAGDAELLILHATRDAPGFQPTGTWDTLGMRATQSIDLEIDSVFVPDEALIHRQPIGHLNEVIGRTILSWGVSSFGAVYSGIAVAAFEWAKDMVIRQGRERDPLIQALFAEMDVLIETGRAVLWRHAQEVADGLIYEQLTVQEVIARASLAKLVPVNNTISVMQKVIDAVGGPTLSRSLPFERLWRDAQAGPVMPFNNLAAAKLIGATAFGIEIAPISPNMSSHDAPTD